MKRRIILSCISNIFGEIRCNWFMNFMPEYSLIECFLMSSGVSVLLFLSPLVSFLICFNKFRAQVMRLSYMQNIFLYEKYSDHYFTDLLGLHSIHNWIQSRRQEWVDVAYKNVNMMRYGLSSKAVSEEVEEGWDIGDDNSTYVSCTGAKGFLASIF